MWWTGRHWGRFLLVLATHAFHELLHKEHEEVSSQCTIQSGVPQGSVLGPILYILYTTDLPTSIHATTGTFADDTVILARHDDPVTASHKLQGHLDQLEAWLKKWRININVIKSVQVTFTQRREQCLAVHINNTVIPQECVFDRSFMSHRRPVRRVLYSAGKGDVFELTVGNVSLLETSRDIGLRMERYRSQDGGFL
jgi:hypothetical protein